MAVLKRYLTAMQSEALDEGRLAEIAPLEMGRVSEVRSRILSLMNEADEAIALLRRRLAQERESGI
jgi:hypothetical protein